MGKKVSQSSMKICKNEKKQLNNLIKVLKPKVYITDSSNFKRLVQELTGNGSETTIISSSSSFPTKLPQTVEQVPVIDIEEQEDEVMSFDALSDSFELYNNQAICYLEDPKQACNQIYLDEYSSLENISMNQPAVDLLAYKDLESWLLDIEPFPCYNNGYAQIEHGVSIYDYELSGLI